MLKDDNRWITKVTRVANSIIVKARPDIEPDRLIEYDILQPCKKKVNKIIQRNGGKIAENIYSTSNYLKK